MKSWAKPIRWTFLVIFCLIAGAYCGLRVWRWASVARDAPVVGLSLDTAWHARAGITTTSYQVALTRAGAQDFVVYNALFVAGKQHLLHHPYGEVYEIRTAEGAAKNLQGALIASLSVGDGSVNTCTALEGEVIVVRYLSCGCMQKRRFRRSAGIIGRGHIHYA